MDDLFHPAKVNLAVLLDSAGRSAEAERLLREVVAANPDLHEIEYSLGKPEESLRALEAAVALEPANPEFLHALAWHHLKQGDAAKAKPFVERLEAAAPGSEVAKQMRQMLQARSGQTNAQ